MVTGKKVIVVESPGSLYPEEFQEPYLRTLLGFIGLKDFNFVHAEKLGYGSDAREAALVSAEQALAAIARPRARAFPAAIARDRYWYAAFRGL